MYDDLVKRLRCLKYGSCPDCSMWYSEEVEPNLWRERCAAIDAADAIESTSKAYQMMAEAYEAEVTKSRWIPVTERLPWAAPGYVSERVLVTDGEDVAIVEWFNFEECGPFWGYTGFGNEVTHWMPLPEPPKEEP